jgi:capsular exopolysaccharide synthesis family protein
MADSSDRSSLHFQEALKVIRNRFWVIFTIFILTVISGAYVTEEVMPKIYTASSQIEITSSRVMDVPGFAESQTDKRFDPTAFQAEFEVMKSPDVLRPVITNLGLDKTWAHRVFKSNLDTMPMLEALGYMNSTVLTIDLKRGTDIIMVTAQSEVPKEASDIANAVIDQYKSMRDLAEDQRNAHGSDSIRQEIVKQQKVVDDARDTVEKLRQSLKLSVVPGSNGAAEQLDVDLAARQRDLLTAKEDADARQVMLQNVQNLPDDQFVDTLEALGRAEPAITALRTEVQTKEGLIDNLLKQGFEENHPRIQALRAEMSRQQQQLAEMIAGAHRALAVDAQMAKSRVDLLSKDVQQLTDQARDDQTQRLGPFRDAERDYEHQQTMLDALTIRLRQNDADRPLMESPVKIISRAEPPEFPSKPNKPVQYALAMVAGLFMGIVVAFLIEYLDTSVKTMADAEMLLGLPVLTVIPNKGGPMPLTSQAARLPHAEGYRILRAKLDLKVINGMGPSVSMLSGGPGEGKSTTIYNLAVVCAQAGQSVILVDCDLRRPTLHSLINVSNAHGLADYLRGEGAATDFIQPTGLSNLHVLTAGDMPLSQIGMLAGDKIRAMLDDLKQRYDLVLVDSPPVLGISDGSIIAREVDCVILVIQHRRYPREISLRAKRAIEEVHGNCVGMVLNCVSVRSDDSYYYYSNYGNYYKRKDKKKGREVAPKNGKGKALIASSRDNGLDSEEF